MASERKNRESVPMSKLQDVARENYTKVSDEFEVSTAIHSGNFWPAATIFRISEGRI